MKVRILVLSACCILSLLTACQTTAKVTAKQAIGAVFDLAGRGDHSYNDAAYQGLVELSKAYHGWIQDDPDKVDYGTELKIQYLQPRSSYEREAEVRALAQSGYPLVYCVGFLFSDPLEKVAKDFPNTHFVIIDAYIPNLTKASNITCLAFRENDGAFLVGAIAALKANGIPIGFLGGMDIPLIHRFENGYIGGAMYADARYRQKGMVVSRYTGTTPEAFNDPARGYQLSKELFNSGVVIIFHAAGGTGAGLFKAAQEANKEAIGVDSDEGLIYQSSADSNIRERGKYILTSMIKRVDIAIVLSGKRFLDSGEHLDGGYWAIGLRDDGLDFAENEYNREQLVDIHEKVMQIKTDVVDGKVEVPDINTDMTSWTISLQ